MTLPTTNWRLLKWFSAHSLLRTVPEAIVTRLHLGGQEHHRRTSSGTSAAASGEGEASITRGGATSTSSKGSPELSPGILQLILGDARDMPVPLVSVRILRVYKVSQV